VSDQRYSVLHSIDTLAGLENRVNELIAEGWSPLGGLIVVIDRQLFRGATCHYYQTLYRPEGSGRPNPLDKLEASLVAKYPDLQVSIDRPEDPEGEWYLDIYRKDLPSIVISWAVDRFGFGLYLTSDDDLDGPPDESIDSVEAAFDRVVELLESG
jgi:hypothetical protein